ncbi:phenylacetate--CoA ligase family protein [uncultured Algibacter sp.]|uniref:phenylacetate--CoA ligase family protein n=1 Tax=uncultured Algibacter sp. TaxID=298659 RepID=UPI0032175872
MKLFDLSLQLKGFPIKKAIRELKAIQNKNESEFNTYLETSKQNIVTYHLKHNPFYKKFAKHIDPTDWNSIPVMNKAHLQQPLNSLLSKGFTKSNVYIDKTSGASGQPFIFSKDKFCHALTWSVIQNRFGWHGIDFNTSKQARFYGIPLDKKGYYSQKLKDFVGNRIRFNVFDLSDKALETWLEAFKNNAFDYLNGYTSAILQFAKFLENKNITLKTVCPTLKVCIVTSEMLFNEDKQLIENQFGVPVVNEYGASELDLIAFENTKNKWVVNSETLFVEILDDDDNPLPYGQEGRLIISSLYNKSQPFIRYDIGDIGMLSKMSTSKKPILKNLTGRTNDVVILPSGKKVSGLSFYYITKSIIEADGNVKEFVVQQLELNIFKILYVSDENLPEEKIKKIKTEIETYLEKGLDVYFEKQDKLIRSKSGKLKQFSSYLNQKT